MDSSFAPPASACVCTTVRKADRALNRLYDQALQPSGLLTTQYALLSTLALSYKGRVTKANAEVVEIVGLYWHFVDAVWILIFTVVYLIK